MKKISDLKIDIYADGADKNGILDLYSKPYVKGLTTNPTLMRKAGVTDYEGFARDILETVVAKPISFEVFSDDFSQMLRQAHKIRSWGENVYVKIPITNSRGESSVSLIRQLSFEGVKVNVTAVLTVEQVEGLANAICPLVPSVVSVFAGRIADTGVDPMPQLRECGKILSNLVQGRLLWASTREVFNIFQAEECGCGIITVPHDILSKATKMFGQNLSHLSLETVRMFKADAEFAGYTL